MNPIEIHVFERKDKTDVIEVYFNAPNPFDETIDDTENISNALRMTFKAPHGKGEAYCREHFRPTRVQVISDVNVSEP